jgi:hypothetical protein
MPFGDFKVILEISQALYEREELRSHLEYGKVDELGMLYVPPNIYRIDIGSRNRLRKARRSSIKSSSAEFVL